MAKRRDMYERLARRKAANVPIKMPQHIRKFDAHYEPGHDVIVDDKVKKVTGILYTRVHLSGMAEDIMIETTVEADKGWTPQQELEKSIRSSVMAAVGEISMLYTKRMAEIEEGKNPPPGVPVPGSAGKGVTNDG